MHLHKNFYALGTILSMLTPLSLLILLRTLNIGSPTPQFINEIKAARDITIHSSTLH